MGLYRRVPVQSADPYIFGNFIASFQLDPKGG